MRSISPYSVQMQENTDQNNFEYGHFPRNEQVYKETMIDKYIF